MIKDARNTLIARDNKLNLKQIQLKSRFIGK